LGQSVWFQTVAIVLNKEEFQSCATYFEHNCVFLPFFDINSKIKRTWLAE